MQKIICKINGREADISSLYAKIESGSKISAVKEMKEIAGCGISEAALAVKAVSDLGAAPRRITFGPGSSVEIEIPGRQTVRAVASGGPGGRSCAVFAILAAAALAAALYALLK